MPSHDAAWTFQLLSIPLSAHRAGERFTDAPQWSDDLHLIHTVEGSGILHVGEARYETTPSNVLVVPVFQHCRWEKRSDGPWKMLNLHARIFEADGSPLHEQSPLPVSFRPDDLPAIHALLAELQQRWTSGAIFERGSAAAVALALVGSYLTRFGQAPLTSHGADRQMRRLGDLLQQQAGSPFDAAALADAVALSISQCNRRFRASYGMSPKAYWQRSRFMLAQSMLVGTADSIKQIADALGFSDIYYFSRWFKQHAQLAPSSFRRKHREM